MIEIPELVKRLYRAGNTRKNYRFVFPDSNHADITNANLISESVTINEKLCSYSTLKFGLCEGSALSFEAFDVGNLSGMRMQALIEIDCSSIDEDIEGVVLREDIGYKVYPINMGYYTVNSSITDASTGISKITAYNKLQSAYLDADAKAVIQSMSDDSMTKDSVTVYSVEEKLLRQFQIERESFYEEVVSSARKQASSTTKKTFKIGSTTYTLGADYITKEFELNLTNDYAASVIWDQRFLDIVQSEDGQDFYGQFYRDIANSNITNPEEFYDSLFDIGLTRGLLEPAPWVIYTDDTDTDEKHMGLYDSVVGAKTISVAVPLRLWGKTGSTKVTIASGDTSRAEEIAQYLEEIKIKKTLIDRAESISIKKTNIPDVTLRDIVSAHYELLCQFGKLDRFTDLFAGVELAAGGLYPSENLYPRTDLYPSGSVEGTPQSIYSELYTNAQNVDRFRYLIITYKGLDSEGQEVERRLQRTVDEHGTVNYNMSSNWLMLNQVWTESQVGAFADAMVEKMRKYSWFPFEMHGVGLPYIECGDLIEINSQYDGSHNSYILERDLKGIWNLKDEFDNGSVNTF